MSSAPQPEGQPIPPASAPSQRPRNRRWDVLAAPGTYLLLGINCAVFIWMVLSHVSVTNPSIDQLLHFGATNPDLILAHGQWWRLVTATFVHVGIVHIGTNMWCLWNLGLLGEPLVGPVGLCAIYLITGIAGNLLSLAINVIVNDRIAVGAGASGAVFGIAGILIVLLSNHRLPIPWSELKRLRRSVIQFAILNLVIGIGANFTSIVNIDNFAHLGGFLSGLALGVPLVPRMTAGRVRYLSRQKLTFAVAVFVLLLFGNMISQLGRL